MPVSLKEVQSTGLSGVVSIFFFFALGFDTAVVFACERKHIGAPS